MDKRVDRPGVEEFDETAVEIGVEGALGAGTFRGLDAAAEDRGFEDSTAATWVVC